LAILPLHQRYFPYGAARALLVARPLLLLRPKRQKSHLQKLHYLEQQFCGNGAREEQFQRRWVRRLRQSEYRWNWKNSYKFE
jgi:hypothetical protein